MIYRIYLEAFNPAKKRNKPSLVSMRKPRPGVLCGSTGATNDS